MNNCGGKGEELPKVQAAPGRLYSRNSTSQNASLEMNLIFSITAHWLGYQWFVSP